jgi:two-component system response regulator GlrR
MNKILVVDDDRNILKVIKLRLEAENYQVVTASDAADALAKAGDEGFDLALVDLKLIGRNGIELMGDLHKLDPEIPIIILTAHGTIKSAVEAMSRGAFSYLTKPFDYHELLLQIQKSLEKRDLTREVKRLQNIVEEKYGFVNIIGKSRKMKLSGGKNGLGCLYQRRERHRQGINRQKFTTGRCQRRRAFCGHKLCRHS